MDVSFKPAFIPHLNTCVGTVKYQKFGVA